VYAWEVITYRIELQYCHILELPRFFHTFRAKRRTPGPSADIRSSSARLRSGFAKKSGRP
jgi:hypothetical protein